LGVASTDTDDGSPGALIQQVEQGSPADSAGLRAGDVITSVDSTSVATANDLVKAIHSHKPGDKVRLTWSRAGQSQSATVTLVSTGG
jgi:putative serine protease PepD